MADLDEFTTVYDKSIAVLKSQAFDKRWSNIETQLKALLAADGPDKAHASVLNLVRASLAKAAHGQSDKAAVAKEILALARSGDKGFQDRAALLKMFKHFYYVSIAGNQDCWVVDHPKGYTRWSYDQLAAKTAENAEISLQMEEEAFGASRRKIMSYSLQHARKWSQDIMFKLHRGDAHTLALVKRWFHGDAATDAEVKASVVTLSIGFKKIAAALNSTKIIFSDHPPERTGGKYGHTFAEVSTVDNMPVIYIFPHFFLEAGANNKGQVGKMWLCALTVIHELSHKLAGTDDNSYDDLGLKPGGQRLAVADAIKTADSWGYFACDMVGMLPADALKSYYL